MTRVRYTLVSEGTTDAILLPILNWLLDENLREADIEPQRADLSYCDPRPSVLAERIIAAVKLYPCDLLFVHRDADEPHGYMHRREEIETAIARMPADLRVPCISVIPVQETEAWFLFDEQAIRIAAGNRDGRMALKLPPIRQLETVASPKERLEEALIEASGRTGRSLRKFNVNAAKRRLSEDIESFDPLRALSALRSLEEDVKAYCDRLRGSVGSTSG